MSTALIVGCGGQDGTYLSRLLAGKSYEIVGLRRDAVAGAAVAIAELQPDEIYYLAAFHHSSEETEPDDRTLLEKSLEVNTLALNGVLAGIAKKSPRSRLFYAASSRIFGRPLESPQDETTPINPVCAYGISKAAGLHLCRYYRERGVFASAGIFYNHESPLRPPQFISAKIAGAAARIAAGSPETLVAGDLEAQVDWGYAPDYVLAAWETLQLEAGDDFVIGSGVLHSVRDFAAAAFAKVGLDWRDHVVEDSGLLRRAASGAAMRADFGKLHRRTGWSPRMPFEEMVGEMVEGELAKCRVS